jgi:SP family galactose:H+ symporter-like MFS transporter
MKRADFIAIIAALGGFLFGYNTGVISGALLFLVATFHLSTIMAGIVTSTALAGAAVGAIFAGQGADRFGRHPMLAVTSLVFIIGAGVSASAGSVPHILAGRALIGLGVGAASMLTPLYISEIAPDQHRGKLVSFNQLAMTTGILVSNLVGYAFASSADWRWMLGLGGIPAVLLGAGLFYLPETPSWLVSHGRIDKAERALNFLRGHSDTKTELALIEAEQNKPRQGANRHFGLSMPLVIGITLAVFQQATGINTVIYFAPVIFQSAGLSSASAAILATAGIGAVNVVMTMLAMWLIDRTGRRPLLMAGLLGMGISLCLLAFGFLSHKGPILGWITAASLSAYVGCFAIGLGPVFWLLIAEIFPKEKRGRFMAVATTANWLANLIVALTFLSLVEFLGRPTVFLLYAGVAFSALLFVRSFVPETKGRSLEDIETIWGGNSPSGIL